MTGAHGLSGALGSARAPGIQVGTRPGASARPGARGGFGFGGPELGHAPGQSPAAGAGLFEAIFRQSPVAILHVRLDDGVSGVIVDANAAAGRLLGLTGGRLVGQRLDRVLAGVAIDSGPGAGPLGSAATGSTAGPLRLPHPAGDRWVTASLTVLAPAAGDSRRHALVIVQDVTEEHIAQERLDRAARVDSLTGVTNRAELLRRLAVIDPAAAGPYVAIVFVDLDGFKRINDTRGHHEGDEVLVAVARRIRAAIRPEDTLARIGGDEFVVLCPRLADPLDARAVADRVRATLDCPVSTSGGSHRLSMSVGIASAHADEATSAHLLRCADVAMYRAKAAGGNRVHHQSVDPRSGEPDVESIADALDSLLHRDGHAAESARLCVSWHPVVSILTGRASYVEALVRLRDRAGTLIPPWRYLPVAARTGTTLDVAALALRTVLREQATWVGPRRDLPLGIDVAGVLLTSALLVPTARHVVAAAGRAPSSVLLEIAEPSLRVAGKLGERTLGDLAAAGFGLALDRFGSEGSSLSALCSLRGHRVKLDWRVVKGVGSPGVDRDLVAATISAAHALGQRVVADGVQTAMQWESLAALGCDEAQGRYVDAAVPLDRLPSLVAPLSRGLAASAGMVVA